MEMPFGKYAGEQIKDIPPDYLRGCLENLERLDDELREEMEEVLGQRRRPPPSAQSAADALQPRRDAIRAVFRELTLRWHPDRGGSVETMTALNEFMARITDILR